MTRSLPVLLAVPVGLGGWLGAKLAMAAMAGLLAAATVWVAIRRFGVAPGLAAAVVLAFSVTAPLVVYGAQVYPELPAALAVTAGIAALTGRLNRRGLIVLGVAVVALPWLSVKYAPVAAALAAVGLLRLVRRGDRRLAAVTGRRPGASQAWPISVSTDRSTAAGPRTPPATTSSAAS